MIESSLDCLYKALGYRDEQERNFALWEPGVKWRERHINPTVQKMPAINLGTGPREAQQGTMVPTRLPRWDVSTVS